MGAEMTTSAQQKTLEWLAGRGTGLSSETMAYYLAFDVIKERGRSHPHDPSDFNRCLKLLHAVPEMRVHLHKMANLSPYWAALVARWDDVERSFLDEVGFDWCKAGIAPKTYRLMKTILDAATRKPSDSESTEAKEQVNK
jgi:hypothetical protein